MNDLISTLETIAVRVTRYRSKGINEQDTKASLIQPVLRAIGWDVEDLDEVQREYKRKKQDKPVDYALLLLRDPRLFVEAKSLGQDLNDRKWANQIMSYASVSGIEWVVLTDGDEYRIYNSHATVPIEEKLFRTIRISDDLPSAAETLTLLSKDKIRENEIDVLWNAHFVDRQVRSVVEQLFCTDPEPDGAIVRLISKRIGNLTAKDVTASLRRARIQFDFPIDPGSEGKPSLKTSSARPAKSRTPGGKSKRKKLPKQHIAVSLVARGSVTGRRMNTNGWTFWQFKHAEGKAVYLDVVRQELIRRNSRRGN